MRQLRFMENDPEHHVGPCPAPTPEFVHDMIDKLRGIHRHAADIKEQARVERLRKAGEDAERG